MTDLLPCPFCGAVPVFVNRGKNVGIYYKPEEHGWDVHCETEGCFAEYGADWWLPQKEAAEMWNRRANTPDKPA